MATITKLTEGQVLYQVKRQKMGNTTASRGALYTVRVVSIDPDGQFIMGSWNNNPARKYRLGDIAKLKVNKPEPKCTVMGMNSY